MKTILNLVLLVSISLFGNLEAQVLQPSFGMPNVLGTLSAGQNSAAQSTPLSDTSKPKKPAIVGNPALEKKRVDLELENQLTKLKTEQILLKEELEKLQGSGNKTEQDKINLAIKKKNLELLFLREQMLLRAELEKYGIDNQNLPEAVIFGQEYFRNPKLRMLNTPKDITPSEGYQLGTGDQIQVDIWGRAGYNGNYTVDEAGFITIPRKQKIFVKGKSLSEVRSIMRSRFAQIVNLSGSNFNVSVSNARSITIHISGEVFYPGTYTLPALNSAFNILSISGGPTNIGTMRNVLIQRAGKIVDTFDLYKYLFGGGSEIFLQNNDYLIVPSIGNVVNVSGGVRKQGKFELKNNEGFRELLKYAGGFSTIAYRKDVVLERIIDHSYYSNTSFNWDSIENQNANYLLRDGDLLEVKYIQSETLWIAKIKGAVKAPGKYNVKEGDSISGLIKRAGGLMRDVYLDKAYLIRTNKDLSKSYFTFKPAEVLENSASDFKLESNDEILILGKQDFIETAFLSTEKNVRNPIKMEFVEGIMATDLLKLSGGIKQEGYDYRVLIERTNKDLTKSIIPIDINENGVVAVDVLMQRNDVLRVYRKPSLNDNFKITLYGEVNRVGSYTYMKNMSLKDLLVMAEGTKKTAEFSRIEIVSVVKQDLETGQIIPLEKTELKTYTINSDYDKDEVAKTITLNPFDQIFIRKAYFNDQDVVVLHGEVKYPGTYAITSKDETLLDVVERAGGFTEYAFVEGAEFRRIYKDTQSIRIIVDLKKAIRRPNSRFNYYLTNNDTLKVPTIDQTIRITGEIENQKESYVSCYYKKGKRAKHYVNNYAGGFAKGALKRKVYVQHANGQNVRTKNFLLFKVYPKIKTGSTIFIPKKEANKNNKLNLDGAITKILTTTTSVLTFIALINLATGG
jgi:protein involved in polysaccharide export with SLBB domain